jgi:hypothetical protein
MGAHADILRSLLQELDSFDDRVRRLTALNDECVALTQEQIGDSAQIRTRDHRPEPVVGKNRSFLP